MSQPAATHPSRALVTGAGRRIGAAMAEGLAEAGTAIVLHVHESTREADHVAGRIRDRGGIAHVVTGDLRDEKTHRRLIADAAHALDGPLDLLINNASIFEDDSLSTLSTDLFDAHMDLHVRAPAFLSKHFAAAAPDGAMIVNIIDQRVLAPNPRFFSYTLSKSALLTMTQTLAQALAPALRVNAIGPGPTLANERQTAGDFAAQVAALPLRRGPALEEFAATILWLWRARSVTGQMIALDGGQHLAWETPDVANITE